MMAKKTKNGSSLDPNQEKTLILRDSEKDNFRIFVAKKTEKLAAAIHLVTNLFRNEEPMKWRIREAALNLNDVVLSFTGRADSKHGSLDKVVETAAATLSLLEIAFTAGMVSEMNFSILKKEFSAFIRLLEPRANPEEMEGFVLLESFFVPLQEISPADRRSANPALSLVLPRAVPGTRSEEGSPSDGSRGVFDREKNSPGSYKGHFYIKDNVSDRDASGAAPVSRQKSKGEARKESRKKVIVDMLKKKSNLSINEFVSSITGCSPKTIQRELVALVGSGVLKRQGERRWSTYSLNAEVPE